MNMNMKIDKVVSPEQVKELGMIKYEGTKQLHATPISLGIYNALRGWDIPENEDPNKEGYLVVYPDGYPSWSPKEVFEESYNTIETYKDRLKIELEALTSKLDKLNDFIGTTPFYNLSLDNRFKLQLQRKAMLDYNYFLDARYNDNVELELTFGQAIEALEQGHCIARKSWNGKNIFICKQVPSTIMEDIIPKMQSLPQSAKDIIIQYGVHPLMYKNQMIIVNIITKEVNSWVSIPSDTFAKDWYIVK